MKQILTLLFPLCVSLVACSGDPAAYAGALGGVKSKKTAGEAELKSSVDKPKPEEMRKAASSSSPK